MVVIMKYNIKKEYVELVTDTISRMKPNLDKDKIHELIEVIVKERFADPSINMDNNVTGDNFDITLGKLCNWIYSEVPVISGNATFYMQPKIMKSPTSDMLRALKKGRKAVKKAMFNLKPGSDEYQMMDLDQQNKKVIMNAEYGGSGAPTAAFYTKYSPAATTLMAQSIITTMAAFFESYVGDNQKFFNINECFDWMLKVIKKDYKIPTWMHIPTKKEVSNRIKVHFDMMCLTDFPAIDSFIEGCDKNELVYLYYANNFRDLIINHSYMQNLIHSILNKLPRLEVATKEVPDQYKEQFASEGDPVLAYNKWMAKEMFLDPYNIPSIIKEEMDEFIKYMTRFVYVEYITPDSIMKLNNHYRNTVLLVDTDSNIINADLFVSYVTKNVLQGNTYGRDSMYNDMILVNVLCATLSVAVAKMLDYYGRCHNMDEESRAELTMKNEFMFRKLFLLQTKKRYAASIVLREGNIIIPFKPEIKGVDFIKAAVSDDVMNRFQRILCDNILFSDDIKMHKMMMDLKKFEREIYEDLKHGGVKYLKQQQYKPADGYSKVKDKNGNVVGTSAWNLQVYRGSVIWNELYPEKKINSLDRVHIIKLIPTNLERIKNDYPEDYAKAQDKILMSRDPDIQKAGLKVICIPPSVHEIPKWIIPLIDYELIISDVIASFRSILDALHSENVTFKTPNGDAKLASPLVSF